MNANLSIKKLIVKGEIQPGKDEEAANLIRTSITLKIAGDLPDDEGPLKMLDWLKSRYGDDNRWDAESDLKNLNMIGIEPAGFLGNLDTGLARVKAAGGNIDSDVMFKILLIGSHQEFYQDYIREQRKINLGEITQGIYDKARKDMLVHCKATPFEIRGKYSARKINRANAARRPYEKRHCTICQAENPGVMGTHNTEHHRERRQSFRNGEQKEGSDAYKANTAYFDSGANQHFFKRRPDHFTPYLTRTFVTNETVLAILS